MKDHRIPLKKTTPHLANQKNGKIMAINTPSFGQTIMESLSLYTVSALGYITIDKNIFSPTTRINDNFCKTLKGKLKQCIELNDLLRNPEYPVSSTSNDICSMNNITQCTE